MYDFLIKLLNNADLPCLVKESIPNSFTVLVGFVAIGIPISLQVISKAAEKYKSDHLISRLSNWWFITPKTIYWVSIFYIVLALIFNSLIPEVCNNFSAGYFQLYAWILIILFLLLLIVAGFWFGHVNRH